MKERKKESLLVRIPLFLILTFLCLFTINRLLVPKFLGDSKWPTTLTYEKFYELEKDSIDVLFMGSSHSVSAFSPAELYRKSGIRSYNLSSDQQNLILTYYWLKEALKTQSPEILILEPCFVFPYATDRVLNSKEAYVRKAVDNMHWSFNKTQLIHAICTEDESYDPVSFYLTNLKYHTRWKELEKKDFFLDGTKTLSDLCGYSLLYGTYPISEEMGVGLGPYTAGTGSECAELLPLMKTYLDKIADLCEQKGIDLILVRTPIAAYDNEEKGNALTAYASKRGITFIDFNEQSVFDKIEFDLTEDMSDYEHINYKGAKKITDILAKFLKKRGVSVCEEDEGWMRKVAIYKQRIHDLELKNITDPFAYLEYLSEQENYSILIGVKNEASQLYDENWQNAFRALGIEANLSNRYQYSYYALITEEGTRELYGNEKLVREGTLPDGTPYTLMSSGYSCGNKCSIVIGNEEYAVNTRGFNIVVYNNLTKEVVDSVVIDTSVSLLLTRAEE